MSDVPVESVGAGVVSSDVLVESVGAGVAWSDVLVESLGVLLSEVPVESDGAGEYVASVFPEVGVGPPLLPVVVDVSVDAEGAFVTSIQVVADGVSTGVTVGDEPVDSEVHGVAEPSLPVGVDGLPPFSPVVVEVESPPLSPLSPLPPVDQDDSPFPPFVVESPVDHESLLPPGAPPLDEPQGVLASGVPFESVDGVVHDASPLPLADHEVSLLPPVDQPPISPVAVPVESPVVVSSHGVLSSVLSPVPPVDQPLLPPMDQPPLPPVDQPPLPPVVVEIPEFSSVESQGVSALSLFPSAPVDHEFWSWVSVVDVVESSDDGHGVEVSSLLVPHEVDVAGKPQLEIQLPQPEVVESEVVVESPESGHGALAPPLPLPLPLPQAVEIESLDCWAAPVEVETVPELSSDSHGSPESHPHVASAGAA